MSAGFRWLTALAIAVFIGVAAWSITRYYASGTITLSDGTVVDDVSIAEAGEAAMERFKPERTRHLEAMQAFVEDERLPLEDLSGIRFAVTRLYVASLDRNPAAARALDSASPDAEVRLRELLVRATAAMAGVDREEYLALNPDLAYVGFPLGTSGGELKKMVDYYSLGGSQPESGDPADGWQPTFDAFYELLKTHRDGGATARSLVAGEDGFAVAVGRMDLHDAEEMVTAQCGNSLAKMAFETSSQAQLNFFHRDQSLVHKPVETRGRTQDQARSHSHDGHGHSHPNQSREPEAALHAVVFMVIEDRSGDTYPIRLSARFDEDRSEWTLAYVSRLSSVRAFAAPPFVF